MTINAQHREEVYSFLRKTFREKELELILKYYKRQLLEDVDFFNVMKLSPSLLLRKAKEEKKIFKK